MKSSPVVSSVPCTASDAYREIETKDVSMLRTEHKIATKSPIWAMLCSPGRVMSITDTLRIMTDWEVQRVRKLGDDFQHRCCPHRETCTCADNK